MWRCPAALRRSLFRKRRNGRRLAFITPSHSPADCASETQRFPMRRSRKSRSTRSGATRRHVQATASKPPLREVPWQHLRCADKDQPRKAVSWPAAGISRATPYLSPVVRRDLLRGALNLGAQRQAMTANVGHAASPSESGHAQRLMRVSIMSFTVWINLAWRVFFRSQQRRISWRSMPFCAFEGGKASAGGEMSLPRRTADGRRRPTADRPSGRKSCACRA